MQLVKLPVLEAKNTGFYKKLQTMESERELNIWFTYWRHAPISCFRCKTCFTYMASYFLGWMLILALP